MPEAPFIFLCEPCGWKRVCPIHLSGLQEMANDSMSSKKFRCPSCGRGLTPRKFPDPQSDVERIASEQAMKSAHEEWLQQSAEFQKSFIEEKDGKGVS